MNRPPEAYMHIGIVQFMLHPDLQTGDGPAVEAAEALASDGFFHALWSKVLETKADAHAFATAEEAA